MMVAGAERFLGRPSPPAQELASFRLTDGTSLLRRVQADGVGCVAKSRSEEFIYILLPQSKLFASTEYFTLLWVGWRSPNFPSFSGKVRVLSYTLMLSCDGHGGEGHSLLAGRISSFSRVELGDVPSGCPGRLEHLSRLLKGHLFAALLNQRVSQSVRAPWPLPPACFLARRGPVAVSKETFLIPRDVVPLLLGSPWRPCLRVLLRADWADPCNTGAEAKRRGG